MQTKPNIYNLLNYFYNVDHIILIHRIFFFHNLLASVSFLPRQHRFCWQGIQRRQHLVEETSQKVQRSFLSDSHIHFLLTSQPFWRTDACNVQIKYLIELHSRV